MLQSTLFPKTRRNAPKGETSANARFLVQAGYVDKLMAGVYTYLPLGLRVIRKIENIIRNEMFKAGGAEILMPALQPREPWVKTGRWATLDILFKITSQSEDVPEMVLGPTHEEVVVPLLKKNSLSYRDLPFAFFQIQNKFRDEKRAKSGILRGREFLMKDLYSFHADEKDMDFYYEKIKNIYKDIFGVFGIGKKTYLTYASGGSFSKYSHEFQMVTPAGEDKIYLCETCEVAVNAEIVKPEIGPVCPVCDSKNLKEERAIEVGNIFKLKTKFSEPFGLVYKNESGEEKNVIMGCYGIGVSRLMGAIAEALHDEKGLIWPKAVAPFTTHLLSLGKEKSEAEDTAYELYRKLERLGVEVLYDDRQSQTAGDKFMDADLLGIPLRVVVSEKTIREEKYELKERGKEGVVMLTYEQLVEYVQRT